MDVLITEIQARAAVEEKVAENVEEFRAAVKQRLEQMKQVLQRDDRVVMCPVGSGRPSLNGMRGFDSDSLCQKKVDVATG